MGVYFPLHLIWGFCLESIETTARAFPLVSILAGSVLLEVLSAQHFVIESELKKSINLVGLEEKRKLSNDYREDEKEVEGRKRQ